MSNKFVQRKLTETYVTSLAWGETLPTVSQMLFSIKRSEFQTSLKTLISRFYDWKGGKRKLWLHRCMYWKLMIGSKEMAELEQKKCSNIPLLLKAVKITVVTMWRCWFLSMKITTGSQFVCLISFSVWGILFGDEMNPVLYYADNPKTLRALKVVARATWW